MKNPFENIELKLPEKKTESEEIKRIETTLEESLNKIESQILPAISLRVNNLERELNDERAEYAKWRNASDSLFEILSTRGNCGSIPEDESGEWS